MVLAFCVVTMYNYHPWRLAKSNILKQYFSHGVNVVCDGSPSRMRRVLLISFGMTILPKSSTRRTMPVAFISFPLLAVNSTVVLFAGNGELSGNTLKVQIFFPLRLILQKQHIVLHMIRIQRFPHNYKTCGNFCWLWVTIAKLGKLSKRDQFKRN